MINPKTLIVEAGVRYWEDATVNGQSDDEGTLIPFRKGELWCPRIDLEKGRIIDWPQGTAASIHYKVCDAGEYWIEDADGKRWKLTGSYVPDKLLCVGDTGYGDYIIMGIAEDGQIVRWAEPSVDDDEWEAAE